jgi:hypothetical protein
MSYPLERRLGGPHSQDTNSDLSVVQVIASPYTDLEISGLYTNMLHYIMPPLCGYRGGVQIFYWLNRHFGSCIKYINN